MKIHEYQAKAILAKYRRPRAARRSGATPSTKPKRRPRSIGGSVVVKAQIHAGGRGKGGGVKVAKDAAEAAEIAEKILGMTLVTHQTGPEGRVVQRLLIEETLPIERELYLGIVLDRARGKNVFMASADGGMEIEEVAAKTPERILKEPIEPGPRPAAVSGAQAGVRDRHSGPRRRTRRRTAMIALAKALRSDGRIARRNQSVHPDQGRQGLRARRQDQPRRQRAVPPQGSAGAARSERRRSAGSGSLAASA